MLCARKFSFDPQGDLPAAERPQHCALVIIIFKALRLAAAVFMYFFNLAAAERPQHCALVFSVAATNMKFGQVIEKNGPKKFLLITFSKFCQKVHFWGPKWAGLDFSWTVNVSFPKEDHKISFYTNKRAMLRSLGGGQIEKN